MFHNGWYTIFCCNWQSKTGRPLSKTILELQKPSLNHRSILADPGFSWGGGVNSPGGANIRFSSNFPKNCMKLKEFGPPPGARGTHAPFDPPLDHQRLLPKDGTKMPKVLNNFYTNMMCLFIQLSFALRRLHCTQKSHTGTYKWTHITYNICYIVKRKNWSLYWSS